MNTQNRIQHLLPNFQNILIRVFEVMDFINNGKPPKITSFYFLLMPHLFAHKITIELLFIFLVHEVWRNVKYWST